MSRNATVRVTRYQDWKPEADKFEFMDKPLKTQAGGLVVGYRYDGAKLRVKTPKVYCHFGLQTGMDGRGFNLQCSFGDTEKNSNLAQFLSSAESFDEGILQGGLDHPDSWFAPNSKGKAPSKDAIEDKYHPMVKWRLDKETKQRMMDKPATFKVKLPSKKVVIEDPDHPDAVDGKVEVDAFQCRLYNADKEQINIDDDNLPGGCYVSMLMSASSIWSTTTGFGATWKAEQIMVFPPENRLPDICLLDADEEGGAEQGDSVAPAEDQEDDEVLSEGDMEDAVEEEEPEPEDEGEEEADEEEVEEEDDEPEPTPEPVKTKKKATVRKAKK